MREIVIDLSYLVASLLFILGLKGLSHPRTAVRANLLGAGGMLTAVVATLFHRGVVDYRFILIGLAVGATVGTALALRIRMTAMPEMVALLNGLGGAASGAVAGAALTESAGLGGTGSVELTAASAASGMIGGLTLTGSLVAFGKLRGWVRDRPVLFPGQRLVGVGVAVLTLVAAGAVVLHPETVASYGVLVAAAALLGALLVLPIGGADMPVVIALLNSYSGLAASATGFVLRNDVLIIAGSLVGASGLLLTTIMCRAMNRSLAHVLLGGLQETSSVGGEASEDIYAGRVRATSAEEVAMLLEGARRVVIVPGYGMAVAQAQHAVHSLANLLERNGTSVEFGIHPVAGRMPGHMNVLLAEASVPYERLLDLDQTNAALPQTDVAIVIGANDVVNPSARTDPDSPIAGMPILDVDAARTVIVVKRSLSPGFAGIPNPLFVAEHTRMLFADGRQAIQDIIASVEEEIAA